MVLSINSPYGKALPERRTLFELQVKNGLEYHKVRYMKGQGNHSLESNMNMN